MREILSGAIDRGVREVVVKSRHGKKDSCVTLHVTVHDKEQFIGYVLSTGADINVSDNQIVLCGGIYNEK